MFWVVQSNLYKEVNFQILINSLKRMQIDFALVKPLSFTLKLTHPDFDLNGQDIHDIPEPFIDNRQNIMVCGAYTMAKIAKDRGWTPGAFLNENFNFNSWCSGWGAHHMLNEEAITAKVKDIDIPIHWNKFFARPTEDTKSFSGTVFNKPDFEDWLKKLKEMNSKATLNGETTIMIAPLKNIYCEYRLFVVDKKIVTGSLYKLRDQVIYSEILDENVLSFAKEMIQEWTPDRAFVLDIAITDEGMKIIEVNNINSSGFYKADVGKFIMAIEDMKFEPSVVQKYKS